MSSDTAADHGRRFVSPIPISEARGSDAPDTVELDICGDTEEIPLQGDARGHLLMLATWLEAHPEVDRQMSDVLVLW